MLIKIADYGQQAHNKEKCMSSGAGVATVDVKEHTNLASKVTSGEETVVQFWLVVEGPGSLPLVFCLLKHSMGVLMDADSSDACCPET